MNDPADTSGYGQNQDENKGTLDCVVQGAGLPFTRIANGVVTGDDNQNNVENLQTQESGTALVLSAGGMFGAYQAGAWLAIEERLALSLVVGASAGALNGWAIAGGSSARDLMEHWRDPAIGKVLALRAGARWRNGWMLPAMFDPAPLREYCFELHARFTPRLPYALTVTRVPGLGAPGLEPLVVRTPHVTPEHLVATASIPFCFRPVQIGEHRYTDGGLLEKLPTFAARAMGARRAIAIDCLKVEEWWLRMGMQAWRALRRRSPVPDDIDLTLITPAHPLGSVKDAVFWKRDNIDRWIDQGYRDADRAVDSLRNSTQNANIRYGGHGL